jgi:hypothetical protein
MRITSSVVSALLGLLAGIVLMISCDDSPGTADAATCDCPAAELPIPGRIKRFSSTRVIAPGEVSLAEEGCPEGALVLSGACSNDPITSGADLTLQQSGDVVGAFSQGWICWFKNNSGAPVTVKATAICLMPGA